MERSEFRQRMDQFKQARESNPQLSYWEWKSAQRPDDYVQYVKDIKFIQDINKRSNANFVKRLQQKNRQTIPDWKISGNIATHKLEYATDESGENAIVYPNVKEKYRKYGGLNTQHIILQNSLRPDELLLQQKIN